MKKILYIATIGFTLLTSSCNDFLDRQVPQGIVTGDQIASPEYVDNLVISAYAIWATGDDINSSFSLWNYDVRSDVVIRAVPVRKTAVCSTHWRFLKVSTLPTGTSTIYGKTVSMHHPCQHSPAVTRPDG